MSYGQWEIIEAQRVLERAGYIIRRPSQANLKCGVRVGQEAGRIVPGMIPLRLDTTIDGTPFALVEQFPIELLLGDKEFREGAVPRIFSSRLAHYIAERWEGLADAIATGLKPLVERYEEGKYRMGLRDIEEFIACALNDPKFDPDAWEEARRAAIDAKTRGPRRVDVMP